MITAKSKNGKKVYVTSTEDCGDNVGGLFCQVYADRDMENEIDYFTLSKEEIEENTFENLVREYVECETY